MKSIYSNKMNSIFDEFDIVLSKYIENKYPETITIPCDMIDLLKTTTRLHNGKRVNAHGKEVDISGKLPDHAYIYATYPIFITNKGHVRILYGYDCPRYSSDIKFMLYYETYYDFDITISQLNHMIQLYNCVIPKRGDFHDFISYRDGYKQYTRLTDNITNLLKREFGS